VECCHLDRNYGVDLDGGISINFIENGYLNQITATVG
jgi:hypothetical protein